MKPQHSDRKTKAGRIMTGKEAAEAAMRRAKSLGTCRKSLNSDNVSVGNQRVLPVIISHWFLTPLVAILTTCPIGDGGL